MTQDMDLQEAVQKAKESVSGIDDEELRKIAFDRVLQHLLDGGRTEVPATKSPVLQRSVKSKKNAEKSDDNADPLAEGPKVWLEELIDQGFFDEPKHGNEIVDALADNGHHLTYQDLTRQLVMLKEEKKLRRKKLPRSEDNREVWHYSKW